MNNEAPLRKLTKNQKLAQMFIARNPDWKSPVQILSSSEILSLAQWVNQNGDPVPEMIIQVEYRRQFVDAIVLASDMRRDKADPGNYGYWHRSLVQVQILATGLIKWHPFSMCHIRRVPA